MKKTYIQPSAKEYNVETNNILAGSETPKTKFTGDDYVTKPEDMGAKGSTWDDDDVL